jgi:polyhydroxyalkanoate synthesis regulator phasin
MKKRHTIIISCVLAVGIIVSGLALADNQSTGNRRGFGSKQRHKGGGLMMLAKYQQKNLMVQVLSEMTKQPAADISTKLKEQGMRGVMQEFNIDRQAFRTATHAKVSERVKQAVKDGSITPEQEKEILEKIENRSQRREVMKQLIEKGIADGTITQEDAQMLLHKRR